MSPGLDFHAVRTGIAAAARSANGIKHASEYIPEKLTTTPAAVVAFPRDVLYNRRFGRGPTEATFQLSVICGRTFSQQAQLYLDAFMSNIPPEEDGDQIGVKEAIEADRTLGGACTTSQVLTAEDVYPTTFGDLEYLAVDFLVRVYA